MSKGDTMVLFINNQNIIYAINEEMKKEDVSSIQNAIWQNGDFSFFEGEEKDGFLKIFRWNGEQPEIEYQAIPIQNEITQFDRIEYKLDKSQDEIRQEGADLLMVELQQRGIISLHNAGGVLFNQ